MGILTKESIRSCGFRIFVELLESGLNLIRIMFEKRKKISKEKPLIGYKGFDKDLASYYMKTPYKVGEEYECNGEIKVCENGFHACANPLDVFTYYSAWNLDNRFCRVAQWGSIDKNENKIASSNIKILEEISLQDMFEIASKEVVNTRFIEHLYVLNEDNKNFSTNECFKKIILNGNDSISFIKGKFNNVIDTADRQKIVCLESYNTINVFGVSCDCFVFANGNNIIIHADDFYLSRGCYVLIFADKCKITILGSRHHLQVLGKNNTIRLFNKDNDIFVKKDNTIIYSRMAETIHTSTDLTLHGEN